MSHQTSYAAFVKRLFTSSLGMKMIMALTGIGLWGFMIIHVLGNLQVLLPTGDAINDYAVMLKSNKLILWGARLVLLKMVILHAYTGLKLASQNKKAKGVGYRRYQHKRSSFYSRTMRISGSVVLLFIIFHILHFTGGVVEPDTFAGNITDAEGRHDVYVMVRSAFSNIGWVLLYAICNALLVAHLIHGTQSLWQSLGFRHSTWTPILKNIGWVLVAFIFIGNVLVIPFGVFFSAQ